MNQDGSFAGKVAFGRAVAVRCDVTRSEDVRAPFQQAVDAFGRLDVAFNNAGAEQAVKPAAETTEQDWDRIIASNLRCVLVPEVRDPAHVQAGGRRDRQHLLWRRSQGLRRWRRVRGLQVRRGRPQQVRPLTLDRDAFLVGDTRSRYYAGRLIRRDGQWLFVAWRADGGDGRFLGELSDPMPLTVHPDGSLSVQLPVAAD
jgi:hypothetical protein